MASRRRYIWLHTRTETAARITDRKPADSNGPAMKRTILQLVVVLYFVGSGRADETIKSVQQALQDQGFYYGNVTGENSAETTTAGVNGRAHYGGSAASAGEPRILSRRN